MGAAWYPRLQKNKIKEKKEIKSEQRLTEMRCNRLSPDDNRLSGLRLNKARKRLCASEERKPGIPSLARNIWVIVSLRFGAWKGNVPVNISYCKLRPQSHQLPEKEKDDSTIIYELTETHVFHGLIVIVNLISYTMLRFQIIARWASVLLQSIRRSDIYVDWRQS